MYDVGFHTDRCIHSLFALLLLKTKKNEKVVRAAHLRGTRILCLHCENSHPLNNTTTKKPHLLESLFSLFYVCNLVDMCNE